MKPTIEQIEIEIEKISTGIKTDNNIHMFCLEFTKKMMGEPSGDMMSEIVESIMEADDVSDIFKGMVNQAIKEVEDEN